MTASGLLRRLRAPSLRPDALLPSAPGPSRSWQAAARWRTSAIRAAFGLWQYLAQNQADRGVSASGFAAKAPSRP